MGGNAAAGGQDYQRYMQQGGHSGQGQAGNYSQYMQQGGHAAPTMMAAQGGDFSHYYSQYMGGQGSQSQGGDYSHYYSQYMGGNHAAGGQDYQKYMQQGGQGGQGQGGNYSHYYSQYMQQGGRTAKARVEIRSTCNKARSLEQAR